jgi:putative phage-type endonuclease
MRRLAWRWAGLSFGDYYGGGKRLTIDRAEWLKERSKGLGASDCAAALGMSQWTTPYQLYLDKRGESNPKKETPAMRRGTRMEPIIRQEYEDETGHSVTKPEEPFIHPEFPWMRCNLDGLRDDGLPCEFKSAAWSDEWGLAGIDQMPTPYYLQCVHTLLVLGKRKMDLAVLIAGSDFRIYNIDLDAGGEEDRAKRQELIDLVLDEEADFWHLVQTGTPPEITDLPDLRSRYRYSMAKTIEATEEVLAACARLKDVKAKIKGLEDEESVLQFEICQLMGEYDTLIWSGKSLATWKTAKAAKRIDTTRLRQELPEVAEKYSTESEPSRRFLLKG